VCAVKRSARRDADHDGQIRKVFQKMPAAAAAKPVSNRTEPSPRQADPLEAFRARCEARAALYAAGEFDLHEAVDVLQEFAERLGLVPAIRRTEADHAAQDFVQSVIAAAFAPVRAAEKCSDAKFDATLPDAAEPEPIPIVAIHGVASAAALQREYERSIRRRLLRYGPPKATRDAADHLARTDSKQFEAWLMGHPTAERTAIVSYLKQKRDRS
jgi:hypothetical protein